ncbi:MAG: GTP-binding protein [Burkholderiales bacterium]|nr:GTP-binding protein [Burkholderiales bacterium]
MSFAIPITLLTGYLGSGKTSLLARLLAHPDLCDTAVLMNELGDIALDHDLLYPVAESVVLLGRGCLCCALRDDLAEQLEELYTRRLRKEVPPFRRVVIETTGLADPAPILQTLVAEPVLASLYRLDAVVATADGQLGLRTLDRHFESVKQAALADRIVVTKVDIVAEAELQRLESRLCELNPAAPILRSCRGDIDPGSILDIGFDAAGRDPGRVEGWLHTQRYLPVPAQPPVFPGSGPMHDRRIRSFALTMDEPVSGAALWRGIETLIEQYGEQLLRVKGIVNVRAQSAPRVIHIVQHVLYPVLTLPGWPDEDRRTRLVFIVRDLDQTQVLAPLRRALAAC